MRPSPRRISSPDSADPPPAGPARQEVCGPVTPVGPPPAAPVPPPGSARDPAPLQRCVRRPSPGARSQRDAGGGRAADGEFGAGPVGEEPGRGVGEQADGQPLLRRAPEARRNRTESSAAGVARSPGAHTGRDSPPHRTRYAAPAVPQLLRHRGGLAVVGVALGAVSRCARGAYAWWPARKLRTSAVCTQVSRSGSSARYGLPSGAVPRTRVWMRRTRPITSRAAGEEPKVVVVMNRTVPFSRPTGSARKSECWSTPAMASGCSDWSMRAANPPVSMPVACPCTRHSGSAGSDPEQPRIAGRSRDTAPASGPRRAAPQ